MSEIRDFLAPMEVPSISSPSFVTDFDSFCKAIKDNINKIVSAPFLKGDRGSRVRIKNEYLKIQVDAGGNPVPPGVAGDHEEWSDFAKDLIRAIYKSGGDMPLPLMDIDESHPDGLVTPEDDEWEDMVSIDGGCIEVTPEDPEADPEMFFSYDLFKTLEYIPVCYDEDSGKKFLCVPFYFFDGRLSYIGYLEESLPLFKDMSATVFGEADLEFEGDNPTLEEIENQNCWKWTMGVTNAFPKLYYNEDIGQFCWEVAGEMTNIIAQGLKGDKGDRSNMWVCAGEIIEGGAGAEIINITDILSPYEGLPISNIKDGDLALVLYEDIPEHAEPGEESIFYRMQFGIAKVSGNQCYINYQYDTEIIHKLRNYSLHDYLRSIGEDPEGDENSPVTTLYVLERGSRANAIAMWASRWDSSNGGSWRDSDHFIAPISYSKCSGNMTETNRNTLLEKTLNILYDTVVFKKEIQVDNIVSNNGLNTSAIGVLQTPITGGYLKEYRLGVLCNILSARKSDNEDIGRMGEGKTVVVGLSFDSPSSGTIRSTGSFLFIECELIAGWIPSELADIFNSDLNSNGNNPTLDIYRAQKYHIYVRVPVSGSVGESAVISLDGREWKSSILLNSSLSHKGSGRIFSISVDSGLVFDELVSTISTSVVNGWFENTTTHIEGMLTGYRSSSEAAMEFYYEYLATSGDMRKDKVEYRYVDGTSNIKFFLNQFKLSGGSFKMSCNGNEFNIDNLFWFGSRNAGGGSGFTGRFQYPLINDGFSFLNYFKKSTNEYIRTTNNEGNYMWQGRILSANPTGNATSSKKQDLYYINTSYYETLGPRDFSVFIVKNPDNDTYNPDTRHISRVPIGSAVHIYPEGVNGLAYERVVVTSNNSAWSPEVVDPSTEEERPFNPPYSDPTQRTS